jgi:hypothetical protein
MMDEATAKQLREPFAAELVGKLPRVWCGACREARGRVCDQHHKVRCADCRNTITNAHLHLDFVGHADVTDRLLAVDPSWTWEPLALDQHGLPALDDNGGLWIRLTVAGVTRLGYGHPDGKRGGDAIKESIGDAIRNAGMRFGVGIDLWRKEPQHSDHAPQGAREKPAEYDPNNPAAIKRQAREEVEQARQAVIGKATAAIESAETGQDLDVVAKRITEVLGKGLITPNDAVSLRQKLIAKREVIAGMSEQE